MTARPLCLDPSEGFLPIARADARVLVLGSLPGRQSLAERRYYAHPRNAFWPIVREVFGIGGDYAQCCEALRNCRVALWDVLRTSVRAGSLDAAIEIETATANDFAGFFREHSDIELIAFNGKKAQQLFKRLVAKPLWSEIAVASLPSTSPAYAAMPFSVKQARWQAALTRL